MRMFLMAAVLSVSGVVGLTAQSETTGVVGTWTGPAACRHGGGEVVTLRITRHTDGTLRGATDWARSSSDGGRGPVEPFTTLTVDDTRIKASTTANGRTIRLDAVVDGDTMRGSWLIDGDDDTWTFTGTRRMGSGGVPRR